MVRSLSRFIAESVVYASVIIALLMVFDFPSLWSEFQGAYPFIAMIVHAVIVWLVSFYVVTNSKDIIGNSKRIKSDLKPLIKKLIKYAVYIIALVWTLNIFGLTGAVQSLLVGAGFAGIVVGFAARDVLSNLLAGLSILADRPFKINDWIELPGRNVVGVVKEMSLRSTTLVSSNNTPVNVPNSVIDNEVIINYSKNNLRRLFLNLSITYDSDVNKAVRAVKSVLEEDEAAAKEKEEGGYFSPVEVVLTDFKESGMVLEARVFVNTLKEGLPGIQSRLLNKMKEALKKEGISIAYPHQVIIKKEQ